MGYFKSFTANAQNGLSTTVRIDRDIHTLLVRRLSGIQTDWYLRERNPELVDATVRNHTGKLEDFIKRARLADLAAYAQSNGGSIWEMTTKTEQEDLSRASMAIVEGLAIPTAGKWLTVFEIQLTADGVCVSTNADDDFVFSFTNLVDGATYDFIGLEGEVTGTNVLYYNTIDMLKDQRQLDLDVDSMVGIVFPNTSAFTRMLLTYANQRISKFSLYELKHMCAMVNPVIMKQAWDYPSARDIPSMQADVLAFPLHSIKHIELDTTGQALSFLTVFNRSRLAS